MTNPRHALVLSPEAPYPVIGGGALRTASVVEYLRRRYAVHVITCREPGAPDPRPFFPPDVRVDVIDLPYHSKSTAARAARNLSRFVRGVPPLIDRFHGFVSEIEAIERSQRTHYEVGVIEHFWAAHYAPVLRPICRRLVLNLHNVESVLLDRCADAEAIYFQRLIFRRWAASCRRLEAAAYPLFDTLLVTSEEDARLLPGNPVVYPNAIPLVGEKKTERSQRSIVFSGNLAYQPNVTAVRWFAREVWPGLKKRLPELTWRLVGRNDAAVRPIVAGLEGVSLTGPVPDALEAIAESAVSIAPILSGSGTRIKIIEAFAAGVPVVSTPIGAEGLPVTDGVHLLLASDAGDFEAAIVKVLQTPGLSDQLSAAGRRLYEQKLTWEAVWSILNRIDL